MADQQAPDEPKLNGEQKTSEKRPEAVPPVSRSRPPDIVTPPASVSTSNGYAVQPLIPK